MHATAAFQAKAWLKPAVTSSLMYYRQMDFFDPRFDFYEPELLRPQQIVAGFYVIHQRLSSQSQFVVCIRRKFGSLLAQLRYLAARGVFSRRYVEGVVYQLEARPVARESLQRVFMRGLCQAGLRREVYVLRRPPAVFPTAYDDFLYKMRYFRQEIFNPSFAGYFLYGFYQRRLAELYLSALPGVAAPMPLETFFRERFLSRFEEFVGFPRHRFFASAAHSALLKLVAYMQVNFFKLSQVRSYILSMSAAAATAQRIEDRVTQISSLKRDIDAMRRQSVELGVRFQTLENYSVQKDAEIRALERRLSERETLADAYRREQIQRRAHNERAAMEHEDSIAQNYREFRALNPQFQDIMRAIADLNQTKITLNNQLQLAKREADEVAKYLSQIKTEFDSALKARDACSQSLSAESQRFLRQKEREKNQNRKATEQQCKALLQYLDANMQALAAKISIEEAGYNLRALYTALAVSQTQFSEINSASDAQGATAQAPQSKQDIRAILDYKYALFDMNLSTLKRALQEVDDFIYMQANDVQAQRSFQQQLMAQLYDTLDQLQKNGVEGIYTAGSSGMLASQTAGAGSVTSASSVSVGVAGMVNGEGKWRLKRADGEIVRGLPASAPGIVGTGSAGSLDIAATAYVSAVPNESMSRAGKKHQDGPRARGEGYAKEVPSAKQDTYLDVQLSSVARAVIARYGELEDILNRISFRCGQRNERWLRGRLDE